MNRFRRNNQTKNNKIYKTPIRKTSRLLFKETPKSCNTTNVTINLITHFYKQKRTNCVVFLRVYNTNIFFVIISIQLIYIIDMWVKRNGDCRLLARKSAFLITKGAGLGKDDSRSITKY